MTSHGLAERLVQAPGMMDTGRLATPPDLHPRRHATPGDLAGRGNDRGMRATRVNPWTSSRVCDRIVFIRRLRDDT